MPGMSLARVWRRQLYGASSAALIVPCALLGALVVLALGGGFNGVGVLGQIFAGPPTPSVAGGGVSGGHAGGAAHALPVIPVAAVRPLGAGRGQAVPGGGGRRGGAPVSSGGTGRGGGAVVGIAAPTVGSRPGPPVRSAPPAPAGPGPASSAPASPAPTQSTPQLSPSPKPQPTPVDQIVNAVTPVTQQLPAPVGPAATQVVQSVGSAADGLLPPSSGAPGSTPSVKLP
jgi:hypothetical protein